MNILRKMINLLYPLKCIFCGEIIFEGMVCKKCKHSLEFVNQVEWTLGRRYDCQIYDGVIPTFYYSGNARNAIASLKFKGNKQSSKVLAEYMAEAYNRIPNALEGISFDIIVPVPMHASGMRARGYNQAELLAKELSKLLQIPMCSNVIYKTKKNKTQHNLQRDKRKANVSGIYSLDKAANVVGKNILLVDDVLTTGTTASECANVLKQGKCRKVWIIVVAVAK